MLIPNLLFRLSMSILRGPFFTKKNYCIMYVLNFQLIISYKTIIYAVKQFVVIP